MANKKLIAKKLADRTLLNQVEAMQVIEKLFDIILEEVNNDREVSIVGFGKFYPYIQQPRPVRNPKTQESMLLEPYRALRFKASGVAKTTLKQKGLKKK